MLGRAASVIDSHAKAGTETDSASPKASGKPKIEFNDSTQHGEVKDRRGHMRFFSRSRSTCPEWEQQNLQPD